MFLVLFLNRYDTRNYLNFSSHLDSGGGAHQWDDSLTDIHYRSGIGVYRPTTYQNLTKVNAYGFLNYSSAGMYLCYRGTDGTATKVFGDLDYSELVNYSD